MYCPLEYQYPEQFPEGEEMYGYNWIILLYNYKKHNTVNQ